SSSSAAWRDCPSSARRRAHGCAPTTPRARSRMASAAARRSSSAAAATRAPRPASASRPSTASARAARGSTRRTSTSSSHRSCRKRRRSRGSSRSAPFRRRGRRDRSMTTTTVLVRLALAALAAAAACGGPRDVTPLIRVDPRAAKRLAWLAGPAAPAAPGAPGPARGPPMERRDQLGSSWGFAESGGNIVDAADAHARRDELGQQFTYFGTFPRQGVYDALSSGSDADGSAWIVASGRELYESTLSVTTRYTLHAPDRALLIETTLENTGAAGSAPIGGLSLGDAVQWGGAEKIAPGKARGFKGPSSGPFVGGVGRFASYALTSTEGTIDAVSGSSWTDTVQRVQGKERVSLAPGEKVSYARVFLVGER